MAIKKKRIAPRHVGAIRPVTDSDDDEEVSPDNWGADEFPAMLDMPPPAFAPMPMPMPMPVPMPVPPPPLNQQVIHNNTTCRQCGASPIRGVRYRCAHCPAYDVCAACEAGAELRNPHNANHLFLKLKRVASQPCKPYMSEELYTAPADWGPAFMEGEINRLVTNAANSEVFATVRATVAAARTADEVLMYPLGAHLAMAIREFGWEALVDGGDAKLKLEYPIWLVFSAYAETLGYDMEMEENGLGLVRLRPGGAATNTADPGEAAYVAAANRFLAEPDEMPFLLYVRQVIEEANEDGKADFEHVFTIDSVSVASQFGWEDNLDNVVRLTGQYAELLGWAMQVTETVRNGTDEATVFAAFTKGGDGAAATTTTTTTGGDATAATGGNGAMTDAEFDLAVDAIINNATAFPILVDAKAMLDGAIEVRKKRFVYTMDGNEAAEQFGMGAADHRRVVDTMRLYFAEFDWDVTVKRSEPPTYFLSIRKQK